MSDETKKTSHQEEESVAIANVVVIDYEDLKQQDTKPKMLEAIEEAFGPNGIGLLAVRNVPGFLEAKSTLLPMAHKLVHLPQEYLDSKLTDADSLYNAGWSHGKEKLGDGEPDYAKGSFYYNPCTDCPGTEQDRAQYPLSYPSNLWPSDRLPELEPAAKTMGLLLKDVTIGLATHLDAYICNKLSAKEQANYQPDTLSKALADTEKVKCRLLYYFPKSTAATTTSRNNNNNKNSWIGWHNDSGFLTALAGDYYVDHAAGAIMDDAPDNKAGLYVADRHDNLQRVVIPPDCLAIQMGECTQILSGGAVCATPHMVRSSGVDGVARISLAAFVDTPPTFPLWTPTGGDDLLESKRVPPLHQRWTTNGMTFGDFLTQTFQMYYDWGKTNQPSEE
ncbi:expressed unknown protein [Seminavis robusta]|uniref:Uncharacterized protein n=1 Tax=Seminavis robusta TaxID=568900 RepID=A0A9N8F341_9STRA|nr:expressed unknown protein [Seminavis robusta]|eukprot:Sro2870_g339070.1 n/a (391) ;mRNA; f:2649-3949